MIIIGADMVPTKSNCDLFMNSKIEDLVGEELVEIFNIADFKIFNLELPLTDFDKHINKIGVCLKAPKTAIGAYKSLGVNFLTLANNHIMDYGSKGLLDTIDVLNAAGIAFAGVGHNINEMKSSYIFEHKGKKIGIYCCVEHEFSVATTTSIGANPYQKLKTYLEVKSLKEECDKIIVLYHGGKEHYRFPSIELQISCRELVDAGADLVICQHSHCIGCEEKYNNGTIVYGQGNFLFDDEDNEYWNSGLLIQIDDDFSISYIPIIKNKETVRLANENDKQTILNAFYERSNSILIPNMIQKKYDEFADEMLFSYLYLLSGFRKKVIFRILNKLTKNRFGRWYLFKKYNKERLLVLQNFLECEAHRELLTKGIKNQIEKVDYN